MFYIVITLVAMWFLKNKKNQDQSHYVKELSEKWRECSDNLSIIEHTFNVEQTAYTNSIQNMANQRLEMSYALTELNDARHELNDCLRHSKIDVQKFKELSNNCVNCYLSYEEELQLLKEMEHEFDHAYKDWDVKIKEHINKIHTIKESMKETEMQIKQLCEK
jgi:aspartokinase